MVDYKSMTKSELIKALKEKTKKASPLVKRIAYRGLDRKTKSELTRRVKNARVVNGSDIDYTPRKKR